MTERSFHTPVGPICVVETAGVITSLQWREGGSAETPVLRQAETEIRAYFEGRLSRFTLPLEVKGNAFQKAVCREIAMIAFGETRTYGEIGKSLGVAAQPVGRACGANPIPLVIPCHRVMGAGGKLTGFSGGAGIETKVALLRHEGAAGLLI